ncbi:hypothetical protein PAHAL_4G122300 [Panicum hallii]|uniref:Uncharacterized protein n=1 Tax=Panicum hallii TaxID=206008 RepID=A0A2T8JCP9_9POAL|nr:hypothetical protein PAHAL_4G122300 [Panicum hallii]
MLPPSLRHPPWRTGCRIPPRRSRPPPARYRICPSCSRPPPTVATILLASACGCWSVGRGRWREDEGGSPPQHRPPRGST